MNLSNFMPSHKTLVLGTALWGWGVNRNEAYELLESFFENGGTIVDTSTNYPINKCKKDFGIVIKWLADWKALYESSKFSLIVKIGSMDNMGSPNFDLSPQNIISTTNSLRDKFGDSLSCISIHWDNRGGGINDNCLIDKTVDAMTRLESSGLAIGMSGIRFPELYYKANPVLSDKWIIQVKENFVTSSAREAYQDFFPLAKYLAYGINLGGLKIGPLRNDSSIKLREISVPLSLVEKLSTFISSNHGLQPSPNSLNELALIASYVNPSLSGVIIGPRNVKQLMSTIDYWRKLALCDNHLKNFEILNRLAKAIR